MCIVSRGIYLATNGKQAFSGIAGINKLASVSAGVRALFCENYERAFAFERRHSAVTELKPGVQKPQMFFQQRVVN